MFLGQDKDKADSATSSSTEEQLKTNSGNAPHDTEDDTGEVSGAQFPSVVELNVGGQVSMISLNNFI